MQPTLNKKQQRAWLRQLVQTKLNDDNVQEALELVVESTASLYDVLRELNISKDTCREVYRKDLEDKLNQQNSIVMIDPSNNNKMVSVRVLRDLTKIDQSPPKKENYNCPGYFLKAQLNHELMQEVYSKDFKEKDYEVTLINNVHPDYANRGLANYINVIYGKYCYMRGIKKVVNLIFSPIVLQFLSKLTGGNPTIIKEISLEGRTLNGKPAFKKINSAQLLTLDIGDGILRNIGFDPEKVKKEMQQKYLDNNQQIQPRL